MRFRMTAGGWLEGIYTTLKPGDVHTYTSSVGDTLMFVYSEDGSQLALTRTKMIPEEQPVQTIDVDQTTGLPIGTTWEQLDTQFLEPNEQLTRIR